MRIVHDKDIPFERTQTKHREPKLEFKYLMHGTQGSPQNFEFSVVRADGNYHAPRHRHNFDQIRLTLKGVFGGGKDDAVHEGQVGYYGEGTYYTIDTTDSVVLLLQFGGANGDGFTHYEQLHKAYPEMAKLGEFRDGIFYRHDRSNLPPGVKANQDGYEALWQHIHGKPVTYPKPRYRAPVVMDPAAATWLKDEEQPGTLRCKLGSFTERDITIAQTKVEKGADWVEKPGRAPRLYYILAGKAELGKETLEKGTAIELEKGEGLRARVTEDLLVYSITLPYFSDEELTQERPTACTAAA
jgi:hypothetical protein